MTPDELKAHRRKICEALIEGKQCQCSYTIGEPDLLWQDASPSEAAERVFGKHWPEYVRIKPQPRQCWVGWWDDEPYLASSEESCREWERNRGVKPKWQLVTENTDEE